MSIFPPSTGHTPCPKCGGQVHIWWHERGVNEGGGEPRLDPLNTCWVLPGWPVSEDGQPLDPEDPADEEHLHRRCDSCRYEWVEALVTEEQRLTRPGYEYFIAHGEDEMNRRGTEGWRVVAGWSYGAGAIAIMERKAS